MYNKVKRILGLVAGILSIVIGGFSCLCGLVSLILGVEVESSMVAFTFISVGLGVPLIVMGSKLARAPVQIDGVWEDRKKLQISLIVFLAIISVYALFAFGYVTAIAEELALVEYADAADTMAGLAVLHYLNFLLVCFAMPLNIVSMCLKTTRGEAQAEPVAVQEKQDVVFDEFEQTKKEDAAPVPSAVKEEASSAEKGKEDTLDAKVRKLKQWKEEGIITEEQYEESIKKLLDNIVD